MFFSYQVCLQPNFLLHHPTHYSSFPKVKQLVPIGLCMYKLHFKRVINYMLVFTNVFISDRIIITLQEREKEALQESRQVSEVAATEFWTYQSSSLSSNWFFECWRPFFDESTVITSIPAYAYSPLQRVPPCPCPGWGNKSVSYKVKTLKHKAQQSTLETLVKAKPQRQTSEDQPDL